MHRTPRFLAQRGAAMLETALAMLVLCMCLIAVVEMARFMWLYNTAADAARLASRLASVCETGSAQHARIRAKVRYFIEASGQIQVGSRSDWLMLSYTPAQCLPAACTLVEARLANLSVPLMVPLVSWQLPLPAYQSVQLREAMSNTVAGETNSSC